MREQETDAPQDYVGHEPCGLTTHIWPEDAEDGDTCNCGEWYRFRDHIQATESPDE